MQIVTIPHPALRTVSTEITIGDFGNGKVAKLCKDLSEALATRNDGVGLSAPQIGVTSRAFVVAGKVWQTNDKGSVPNDRYFINPKILRMSKKLAVAEEGCLSIPDTYGMVKRPTNVKIAYLDETGTEKTMTASSLLARIFQHEIDHLDGILFTDKAIDVRTAPNDKQNTEY